MKYTQTQLAQMIGVSQAYISMIIARKAIPSWKTARKLASATNTDPVLWCDGTEDEIKVALQQGTTVQ
jgi:transcriptional regulator with XRE-family HTH domain